MVPDVAKDADSIRNFKRQSNSPANANRPNILTRFDFLKAPSGRQLVVTQEIADRTLNRRLSLFTESSIGFFEAI